MTGRYVFTLYDINNSSGSAAPILNVLEATETNVFQGEHSLTLKIPIYDHLKIPVSSYDGELSGVFGNSDLQEKKYVRKQDTYGTNNDTFIIQSVTTERDGTDTFYIVKADSEWTVRLLDTRIDLQGDFASLDAQTLLNKIRDTMSGLTLALTDIPATERRSFRFAYPTALELLNLITQEFSGSTVYYWGIGGSTIFVYSEGNASWSVHPSPISYGSNLLGITRNSDAHNLANTIYGAGSDGVLNLRMAGSVRHLYDTVSADVTTAGGSVTVNFDDGGTDTNPVMVNSDIFVELFHDATHSSTGTVSWDLKFELLDSSSVVVATKEITVSYTLTLTVTDVALRYYIPIDVNFPDVKKIKLTVTADNSSPFASAWAFAISKLGHTNAANSDTVVNSASVTKYGTVEGVVRIDKPSIYNLHNDSESIGLNPAMSGTYTSGLHAGWTKIGTPTVSENTNAKYIKHGTSSQKVVTTNSGDGVTVDADPFLKGLPIFAPHTQYSSGIWIYIEQGSVKVKADVGENETPEKILYESDLVAYGWNELIVSGWDLGSAENEWKQVTLKITANDANSTFYIDSICEHKGATFLGYTDLHTADELKTKADLAVEENRTPAYQYEVEFTDLFSRGDIEHVIYDSAEYKAGHLVNIDDEELAIRKKLRVKSISYDLLNPTRGKMTLEEDGTPFSAPLAKTIGMIRVNQLANSGARGL